jgi:hypothetical protein
VSFPPARLTAVAALGLACLAACADRVTDPDAMPTDVPHITTPSRGADSAGAAVAGIRFMSPALTVPLRARAWLPVVPVNAQGYPSLALLATPPAIRSANPAVLAVDDSGAVTGVTLGTTKVYATLGTWVDSAVVTVVPSATVSSAVTPARRTP